MFEGNDLGPYEAVEDSYLTVHCPADIVDQVIGPPVTHEQEGSVWHPGSSAKSFYSVHTLTGAGSSRNISALKEPHADARLPSKFPTLHVVNRPWVISALLELSLQPKFGIFSNLNWAQGGISFHISKSLRGTLT